MIHIENVYYKYPDEIDPDKYALKGVDLHIKKGDFVCIIGHNGSGKSTLAKLLNGIYFPTTGTIKIGEYLTNDEDHIWDIRKTAGMVFQNPDNQIVATIVEEDVAFGPENLGIEPPRIRTLVDEALSLTGMSELKHKSPSQLSGGQKQRVAIAGILAMSPECIILDEPTAMLDPSGRNEVMATIKRLTNEGKTIVHITHYMDEVSGADRVIVMDEGKVIMEGTPREIFSQVEVLREIGLDVPMVTEISYMLIKSGLKLGKIALTNSELVEMLAEFKK